MADDTTPAPATERSPINLTSTFVMLRLFMGVRLMLSGWEKVRGDLQPYAQIHWGAWKYNWLGENGITKELPFGDGRMSKIAGAMTEYSGLPKEMIKLYLLPLPFVMMIAGLCILLGIANRLWWWIAGMIWFSLAFGQMLLPDEGTIQQLLIYMLTCGFALSIIDHNRVRITRW